MALFQSFRRLVGGAQPSAPATSPARAGGPVRVLLAPVEGDAGGALQAHLHGALKGRASLSVTPYPKAVVTGGVSDPLLRIAEAARTGRNALEKTGAEVLLWPDLARPGILRLRMVTAPTGEFGSGAPVVTEHLDLPAGFDDEQADVLEMALLATPRPVEEDVRKGRVDTLRSAISAGMRVIARNGLPSACMPAAQGWMGNLSLHPSLRSSGTADVETAVTRYRAALEAGSEVLGEPMVAALRCHLAAALAAIATERRETAVMEEAITLGRAASAVLSRESLPEEYAAIQALLGWGLQRLGTLANRTAYLREAVQAYQLASTVWTQRTHTARWAETQVNVGRLLTTLGEFSHASEFLDQAVGVFHKVAGAYPREKAPVFWANLQNNIGAALFAKSKRSGSAADLQAAAAAYREAVAVFEEHQATRSLHVAKKNLHRVERLVQMRAQSAATPAKEG